MDRGKKRPCCSTERDSGEKEQICSRKNGEGLILRDVISKLVSLKTDVFCYSREAYGFYTFFILPGVKLLWHHLTSSGLCLTFVHLPMGLLTGGFIEPESLQACQRPAAPCRTDGSRGVAGV